MPAHVRELVVASDLIIAINIRLGEMTTDAYSLLKVPIPIKKLIHVHSAESELEKYIYLILQYMPIPTNFLDV